MAACLSRSPGSTCIVTRTPPRLILVAAILVSPWAAAQIRLFEADFEDDTKSWKEMAAQLPARPQDANLLLFETSRSSGHRFFIDAPSVSVGTDGVVRYTLVVKTAGGAVNVSYEGIRCETRQQKYYAIGHANGTWSKARNPQWKRIEMQEQNRHHGLLYVDYLCDGRSPRRDARAVIDALKHRFAPGQFD